jgi:hypothetical protein
MMLAKNGSLQSSIPMDQQSKWSICSDSLPNLPAEIYCDTICSSLISQDRLMDPMILTHSTRVYFL